MVLRSNKGYSLIFALLITGVVVMAAATLARIIMGGFRVGRNIDSAIVATTAAESAIERTLFRLRKTTDAENNLAALETSSSTPLLLNGTTITTTVREESSRLFGKIPVNDFATLDIPVGTSPRSLQIPPWIPGDTCVSNTSFLEVIRTGWNSQGQIQTRRRVVGLSEVGAGINLLEFLESNTRTILRFKPLVCDIASLKVVGDPAVPGQIIIKAVAQYRGSTQAVQAVTLRSAPLAGLFDYVLFSECTITKGENESDSRCAASGP